MNHSMNRNPITVTDPVCGMSIEPETAAATSTYNNVTYHFCSAGCKTTFDAAPAQYAGELADAASCCSTAHSCC